MQGFVDGVPLSVAVSWLKNADGSYVEAPLMDGQPFDFGLLAFTVDGSGNVTRWFVPWTSVIYIKQIQQPSPVGITPQVPVVVRPAQPTA